MTRVPITLLLFTLIGVLLLAACGTSDTDRALVETAVAQTVEARLTQEAAPTPTQPVASATPTSVVSPTLPVPPTVTPTATIPPTPPQPSGGASADCLRANLIDETVPDGTIVRPGEKFYKTWYVKNSGTCPWDSSYKFVFWSGDLMGGAYVYDFPQPAIPGETIPISIELTAPQENGSYRGYWRIQAPSGVTFGVGEYDESLWVDIVVSDSETIEYGVTSVTYTVVRDPAFGCPTNVRYTIYATITTNGPVDVTYRWIKSDDTETKKKTLTFTEADSQTVSVTWTLHLGASTNPRWVAIYEFSPQQREWGRQWFTYDCGG
ncbi:MAG: hypothetical protein D6770_09590 [Anaerolineae bacterium]|nr:MAG: hypothetical protein D6770_09590 [Anaerolineae bacterium]